MFSLEEISQNTRKAINGLLEKAQLKPGNVFVVGCSTSEVAGQTIGTAGSLEIASNIFQEINTPLKETGLYLAVQCCEHLNRALVVSREAMEKYNWEEVAVVPHAHAGGSLATIAFQNMKNPVVVESIQAHAGIDIGDTFIGMHLKSVAVPVRLEINSIGFAHITLARTRPKFIGGARAKYY